MDYILHPAMNLVFNLSYRVRYELVEGKTEEKDFAIAYGFFAPTVLPGGNDIREESVRIDLMTGPGTSLQGDPLWYPHNEQVNLFISFLINTSEATVTDSHMNQMRTQTHMN